MERLALMGNELEIHLGGEETGGSLCVVVDHPPPEFRLVPHRHRDEDETIHVLEGTFEFRCGGDAPRALGPGDTVHVPRGTPHAIRNTGDARGRRVLVFHPAGIERFFRAAATERDPERLAALVREHGWELL